MNIKKLFAALAGVSLFAQTVVPSAGVFGAEYSQELQDAYNWAYGKSITTMSSIDNANMYGAITRAELAKMLANWAKDGGATPDTSKACSFSDTASVKGDLATAIVEACQLGLMGQGITAFRPYDTISRAEFGTALSRALWGDKYEGGTPYYANHLNALKAAGIMNQIANAESTKEVRGYVMLMLMRSEGSEGSETDCDDPLIALACSTDSDACPAECKEGGDDTTDNGKVKAGDLEVSASSSSSKVLANGTSDMDTLTFKSSEEVEITKVIIERYGYSTNDDVAEVWLENEDGTVIAEPRSLDSKGQAKLSIKKDYRIIDGTYNATIVLSAKGSAGKTIGFKVVDVDSTAKNLNIDNYKPNQYDMMEYSGANVTITARGTTKDYNWESGELYEIAKFKVKAPTDSSILVNGFTLSTANGNVDIRKYLDNAEVTVDGKSVSISHEVNKDDQLVISFKKDVEVAAKANVEVVVKASLSDDFDDYGKSLILSIAKSADFNAIDSKTESRVSIPNWTLPTSWPTYNFKWGKVKITNTRLGSVDGAQNSEDIIVAEGDIKVSEDIKGTLFVEVNNNTAAITWAADAISAMRVEIAGDEYEWTFESNLSTVDGSGYSKKVYKFNNVEVVDSGKIQFRVDIRDTDAYANAKLWFKLATWFDSFQYVEAKTWVDIAGSISFATLTIQPAKASLTNSVSKDVEFRNNEVNRKVIFDWEYTAKKGGIKLNEFLVSGPAAGTVTGADITFYLFVDGDEVADAKLSGTGATTTFTNIELAANESVKVKLEAEVDAKTDTWTIGKYDLTLKGEDENGNTAGIATRKTVSMKVVEKGSVTVNTSSSDKKTVLRKSSNAVLAQFTVKPSNSSSEVDLENIEFSLTWANTASLTDDDIVLTINDVIEDHDSSTADGTTANPSWTYTPTTTVSSNGVSIKIELNEELTGVVTLTGLKVNTKPQSTDFSKRFEEVVVRLVKQEDVGSVTKFTVEIDGDDDLTVSDLMIGTGDTPNLTGLAGTFNDGDTFEIAGDKDAAQMINSLIYKVGGSNIAVIKKSDYNDFFKIGDTYARILKA